MREIEKAFYQQVAAAEPAGVSAGQLAAPLGKGGARKRICAGALEAGELEIGWSLHLYAPSNQQPVLCAHPGRSTRS